MTRPLDHAAIRPFRISRAAVEAHMEHAPTLLPGCPLCPQRVSLKGIQIRWTSPRPA